MRAVVMTAVGAPEVLQLAVEAGRVLGKNVLIM
jgi:hypothetical protein